VTAIAGLRCRLMIRLAAVAALRARRPVRSRRGVGGMTLRAVCMSLSCV
jgi:hypothetical protein